jgi:hypothetical protein
VGGAGGARAPPLAAGSDPDDRIDQPNLPLPYIAYVSVSAVSDLCCNYFILMLQK